MFKNCPVITIGDVFTRVDKNGKVWKAEIINRTEYFVDVKKTQPYQIKICDEEPIRQKKFYNGAWHFKDVGGVFHYEDAEPTFERCMIHRYYEEVETDEVVKGKLLDYNKRVKVPTAKYYIDCKEDYSKHWKYDRPYELIKYGDGVEEPEHIETTDAQEGFELFWKYCEEGE